MYLYLVYSLNFDCFPAATSAKTTQVQDVITTDDNPVYMIMKQHKATIDLCDNTAYGVV